MAQTEALNIKPSETSIDTGMEKQDLPELSSLLSEALANTYILYLKTQNFHWNVVGPMFYGIHKMTEEQYQDMAAAVDELAERIRALGQLAPGSFSAFKKLSSIEEETGSPTTEEFIANLVEGNEICSRILRKGALAADELQDVKTADLLVERIGAHEENAWMLRSLLAK